ncbi:MAG TPA: PEGA domain-containing protein [Vicinamibacterales bacterium]|jgi:serine/threonine protein kinase
MDSAVARAASPAAVLFEDGLGVRRHILDQATNETLEMLCLRGELTAVPSFEFALRERVSRLANFRHAYYGRVRRVDRLTDQAATLALVSECTLGARLSEILMVAERRRLALDINAALCLIRQLVPAVAMLHQNARDVAHGALGPERIVVTPHARLVIVDYVLGAALEQLRFSHERYWKEFRIALPRSAGLPRFDHRADVTQIGIVALSLILGRPLKDDEYPARIGEVVASATAMSALGGREPVTPALRSWLARALQIDLRNSFTSALEAQTALDEVLSDDSGYIAAPVALEAFLARYHACAELPTEPLAPVPDSSSYLSNIQTAPKEPRRPEPVPVAAPEPRPVPREPWPPYEAKRGHDTQKEQDPQPVLEVKPVQESRPISDVRKTQTPDFRPAYEAGPTDSFGLLGAETTVAPMADSVTPSGRPSIESLLAQSRARHESPDPFEAFPPIVPLSIPPEAEQQPRRRTLPHNWKRLAAMAAVVLVLVGGGWFATQYFTSPAPIGASVGTLNVDSNPPGAQVVVDGEVRGTTPVNLTLKAGAHTLELRGAGEPRVIPLMVAAGSQVSQYIELPKSGPSPGQLQIRSEPAGARISIDGQPRGVSPMTIGDLEPGEHDVLLESDLGSVRQKVTIQAGATASLVVPLTAPTGAPLSGWLSVSAPVEVQLLEAGRLLGTSRSDRIMVAAGRHDIEIVNETLAYRAIRTVQVAPGRVATISIEMPKGTIALNAIPWAEVWVDGERVGETPIGNLPISIGPHEIVFRHPELGEQRHAATVTAGGPARLSVDLRKK